MSHELYSKGLCQFTNEKCDGEQDWPIGNRGHEELSVHEGEKEERRGHEEADEKQGQDHGQDGTANDHPDAEKSPATWKGRRKKKAWFN